LQGSGVERIERKEGEREKEEEKKPRRYRIATVIIPYIVFLFCVPRATVG